MTMFKRVYFFTVESLPPLRLLRRGVGKTTLVSGYVSHRSFFSDPEKAGAYALKKVVNPLLDFNEGEIILTSLARV
jgi:hypothetical protein